MSEDQSEMTPQNQAKSFAYSAADFEPFSVIEDLIKERTLPSRLYHYTGTAGLVGIVGDETLWLSHASFLNDRSELDYAKSLIGEAIRARIKATSDDRRERYLKRTKRALPRMFKDVDLFVTCFCQEGDLLSQWRGYSKGGGMYSLGFDAERLREPVLKTTFPLFLWPIIYSREEQIKIVNKIVANGWRRYLLGMRGPKDESGKMLDAVSYTNLILSLCLIFFKHGSFEEEQEWRLVVLRRVNDPLPVGFRDDRWYPVPYVEARFKQNALPVLEVKCGPAPEPALATRSVSVVLEQGGYAKVAVTQSDIPLRW